MAGISIKVTMVKAERRSRGRVATSTRTILRNVRDDAHPAQIMRVMSLLFPMLANIPMSYQVNGVRYEMLRVEARTVDGVRVRYAVFKDERSVLKSFAREMRRRHRAGRRSNVRAGRAEARHRRARALTLLAAARSARCTRPTATRLFEREPLSSLLQPYLYAQAPRQLASIPSGQQKKRTIWALSAA